MMNGDLSKGQRVRTDDLLGSTFWKNTCKGVNKAGLEEGKVHL